MRGAGIGVDGCRAGWLAAEWDGDRTWTFRVFPTVRELVSRCPHEALILIDTPIGLPDHESSRRCDQEARKLLGSPRASSVFNPPTRSALLGASWEDSADRNALACGKRLSKQTWAILPKIAEVDALLRGDRTLQGRVREVHPEVLFQALDGGVRTSHPKASTDGKRERLRILERHADGVRSAYEDAVARFPRSLVGRDDVLDAMAAAVTAVAYRGDLTTLPASPPCDSEGLVCEMVLPSIPAVRERVGAWPSADAVASPQAKLPEVQGAGPEMCLLSHVFLGVADFERALRFYRALMSVLGARERFCERDRPWAGWESSPGLRPLFLIGKPHDQRTHEVGNGQMVALAARDRVTVDRAYAVALRSGGSCEGAPGLRPEYHANYYGAYFRDSEGNKLCVVCHS